MTTNPEHSNLTLGGAITQLSEKTTIARPNWAKGAYIYLVPGSSFVVNRAPLAELLPAGTEIQYQPHIDYNDGQNNCSPWTPTQGDLLASDYYVVN